jgi:hypothetical protein
MLGVALSTLIIQRAEEAVERGQNDRKKVLVS